MVWMKHIGCNTPIVEYRGAVPLTENPAMRSADWFDKNGDCVKTRLGRIRCDDCLNLVFFSPRSLTTCDGSPCRKKTFVTEKMNKKDPMKVFVSYPPAEILIKEKWCGDHVLSVSSFGNFSTQPGAITLNLAREQSHWPVSIVITPRLLFKLWAMWLKNFVKSKILKTWWFISSPFRKKRITKTITPTG